MERLAGVTAIEVRVLVGGVDAGAPPPQPVRPRTAPKMSANALILMQLTLRARQDDPELF